MAFWPLDSAATSARRHRSGELRSSLTSTSQSSFSSIPAIRRSCWALFCELGVSIEVHHGSLSREARIDAEEKFKAREVKALLCTSSLELGIDVGQTDFVIQYNSPRQVTRLVQRVGRSEHHVGGTARGIILATNAEEYAEARVIAHRTMDNVLEPTIIRPQPLAVLANQLIALTTEYGRIGRQQVYDIITRAYPFRNLPFRTFCKVVEQLYRQRTLWVDGPTLVRKRRSRQYFLEKGEPWFEGCSDT